MAEHQLPKLNTRVRFPSSAPFRESPPRGLSFFIYRHQPGRGGMHCRYIDFCGGDAQLFLYRRPPLCCCGHDCGRCITYLATVFDDEELRRRSQAFSGTPSALRLSPARSAASADTRRKCAGCASAAPSGTAAGKRGSPPARSALPFPALALRNTGRNTSTASISSESLRGRRMRKILHSFRQKPAQNASRCATIYISNSEGGTL